MKAVVFNFSVPRYVVGKALGGITSSVTLGALSGVKLQDVPHPAIPGPQWTRLKVIHSGICGTDVSTLTLKTSPLLEPFGSFPSVLGHEILAEVVEVGSGVTRVAVGDRVVVEPMISCEARGYDAAEACPSCKGGFHSTCGHAGEEGPLLIDGQPLAPGLTMGYHKDLYGGWGEEMVAHQGQLFRVPDEMDDRMAVLVEPLSIGLHAALQSTPSQDQDVLVVGSGPIAMGTVWALRASGFSGNLVVQAKREKEAKLALELGASQVVRPGPEARESMVKTGAQAYLPMVGPEVYAGGGFPLIYDCVGSRESLGQVLRFAAPRGRVVLLGCANQIRKLDLTFLWARELQITGYVGYGSEVWEGEDLHTFDLTMEFLKRGFPVEKMVTHIFPLGQFRDALKAAANRRKSGAMKVVLKP